MCFPLFLAPCRRLQIRALAANPCASVRRRQVDRPSNGHHAPAAATPPHPCPLTCRPADLLSSTMRRPPRARFGWLTETRDDAPPPAHNVTTLAGTVVCIPCVICAQLGQAPTEPRSSYSAPVLPLPPHFATSEDSQAEIGAWAASHRQASWCCCCRLVTNSPRPSGPVCLAADPSACWPL